MGIFCFPTAKLTPMARIRSRVKQEKKRTRKTHIHVAGGGLRHGREPVGRYGRAKFLAQQ